MRKHRPDYAFRLPTKSAPNFVVKIMSYFIVHIKSFIHVYDREIDISNQKSIDKLGMKYDQDLEQHIRDMLDDFIAKGFLNDVDGDMTNKDFDFCEG